MACQSWIAPVFTVHARIFIESPEKELQTPNAPRFLNEFAWYLAGLFLGPIEGHFSTRMLS